MTVGTGQWKCEVCDKIINQVNITQHKESDSCIITFSYSTCKKDFRFTYFMFSINSTI